MVSREPGRTPRQVFGAMLRYYRERAGLSRPELARQISKSVSLIQAIELGQRAATAEVTEDLERVLSADGALSRLRDEIGDGLSYQGGFPGPLGGSGKVMDSSQVTWRKASYSTSNGGNCVEVSIWRTASYSGSNGGDCVEVGVWRTASHSGSNGGGCVEVAPTAAATVAVRDSKNPDGPGLVFAPGGWAAFTRRIKNGTLDLG